MHTPILRFLALLGLAFSGLAASLLAASGLRVVVSLGAGVAAGLVAALLVVGGWRLYEAWQTARWDAGLPVR